MGRIPFCHILCQKGRYKMKKKVELLAPAGSWEAFLAAVENGADAIYIGGRMFSARQYASNFDEEGLKKALDYAHLRDVKVYMAVNTLLNDEELSQAVKLVEEAYRLGIDAIIVQDIGFASILREVFPDLKLHASTQMTIYNLDGVLKAAELGFERIVLARELELNEIKSITSYIKEKNLNIEIEVFTHGALCICYSGQCLMSSIIGARSGNRGNCAQPCRQKYELINVNDVKEQVTKGFLMSPKDIAFIEELQDLADIGVSSLKIEGRMKNPEYVATVVKTYRKYLDSALSDDLDEKDEDIDEKELEDLKQIFNRGGFSKGYLKGKIGQQMIGFEKPKNWGIFLGEVIESNKFDNTVTVRLKNSISIGDGVEIWNGEDESPGNIITEIKIKGRRVQTAYADEVAELGTLRGKVFKGNKVYRTSRKELLKEARMSFEARPTRKSSVYGKFVAKAGEIASFTIWDESGNKIEVKGEKPVEMANNKPTTKERLIEQLSKLGATPFSMKEINVEIEDGIILPVGEINEIRRIAAEKLENTKALAHLRELEENYENKLDKLLHFPGNSRSMEKKNSNKKVSLFFYKADSINNATDLGADRYYLPFSSIFIDDGLNKISKFVEEVDEVYLWLPSIIKGNYEKLIKKYLLKIKEAGVKGFLVGNLSMLNMGFKENGFKIIADTGLNVFNSKTMEELKKLGVSETTVSVELNLEQIEKLRDIDGIEKELVVFGKLPLMVSEYCPVGSFKGGHNGIKTCNNACTRGSYVLKDRTGAEFPVVCDRIDCRSMILNGNSLFLWENVSNLSSKNIDSIRLNIFNEDNDKVAEIVGLHRHLLSGHISSLDKFADLTADIKKEGFTKGHFFRGV